MSKTIVHIDDDRFLLEMYDARLRKAGCEVYAFQKIDQNIVDDIANLKPDAIVSDIIHGSESPDGIKLCREIQKDERLKNVPFIFLSNTPRTLKSENISDLKIALTIEKASLEPHEVISKIVEVLEKK